MFFLSCPLIVLTILWLQSQSFRMSRGLVLLMWGRIDIVNLLYQDGTSQALVLLADYLSALPWQCKGILYHWAPFQRAEHVSLNRLLPRKGLIPRIDLMQW